MLGMELNWIRSTEDTFSPGLNDQYTAEVYYWLQMLRILTVVPDLQLLFNPALNPDQDLISLFVMRELINVCARSSRPQVRSMEERSEEVFFPTSWKRSGSTSAGHIIEKDAST